MTGKYIFTIIMATAASVMGAEPKEVECTPGDLLRILGSEAPQIDELTVTGSMDARDLETLRSSLPALRKADLSAAKVVELTTEIPDMFNRRSFPAATIPDYAFHNAPFTEMILPASLTAIGEGAFAGSKLETVTFGGSVTSIGDWAFVSTALHAVTLPAVTTLGKGVFENCASLERADLSEADITELPERTFAGAKILSLLSLPESVTEIGREAFHASGLQEIDMSNISATGDFAFADSSVRTANVGDNDLSMGEFFNTPSLTRLEGSPSTIGMGALAGTGLDAFSVNARELCDWAFADIPATKIVLGENIVTLKGNVFNGMKALKEINAVTLKGNIPATEEASFAGINQETVTLIVYKDDVDAWKNDSHWGKFNVISSENVGISQWADETIRNAYFDGTKLHIFSSAPLKKLTVTDQDGRTVASLSPENPETVVETSVSQSKIFVVTTEKEDRKSSFKILRPTSKI